MNKNEKESKEWEVKGVIERKSKSQGNRMSEKGEQ